jgi:hypothetical protein
MEHYFQQIRDELDAADKAHRDSSWQFRLIAVKHLDGEISTDEYLLAREINQLTINRCDAVYELMVKYKLKTNLTLAEERGAMENAAWYDTSAELI